MSYHDVQPYHTYWFIPMAYRATYHALFEIMVSLYLYEKHTHLVPTCSSFLHCTFQICHRHCCYFWCCYLLATKRTCSNLIVFYYVHVYSSGNIATAGFRIYVGHDLFVLGCCIGLNWLVCSNLTILTALESTVLFESIWLYLTSLDLTAVFEPIDLFDLTCLDLIISDPVAFDSTRSDYLVLDDSICSCLVGPFLLVGSLSGVYL